MSHEKLTNAATLENADRHRPRAHRRAALPLVPGWPLQSHGGWLHRVEADIMALAHRRPPEVSKEQWDFIVGWRSGLHGNCGGWRDEFAAELERRLAGPITFADIDWIWDEYAGHTTGVQMYSDRWRPTHAFGYWVWSVMLFLLVLMGPRHPPTADDDMPLGTGRTVLGWLTLTFVVLGFTPEPFNIRG
jgi:hypothetical protein